MLLTTKMASIPCQYRYTPYSDTKDVRKPLPTHSTSPIGSSLQYFNMRVTDRLHRYRSLKRQWNEVAVAIQNDTSSSPTSESPQTNPDLLSSSTEDQIIQDYITITTMKEKNSPELDPLHFKIQKDLIKLRKLIKSRQKKSTDNTSSKPNNNNNNKPAREITTFDDQEQNNNVKKLLSVNKSTALNRVQISGCQMRPSTFPQTNTVNNNQTLSTNYSTSMLVQNSKQQQQQQQQKFKQQNINRIVSIYGNRNCFNLLSDSHIQGMPPPKRKIITPPKPTPTPASKQTQSSRVSIQPMVKKKQPTFVKQEPSLPPIQRSSVMNEPTTCVYTYAASTSAATPSSMKLNRNTSLLPILLSSSSCIGIQPHRTPSGKYRDPSDTSYSLSDYKHSINRLPKPLIPIIPRYGQGDHIILFEQLKHIRETMPDSNVYHNYARIC